MTGKPLRILHVNTYDLGGGAEKIANDLARAARALGHQSWLAVKQRRGATPETYEMAGRCLGPFTKSVLTLANSLQPLASKHKIARKAQKRLRRTAYPLNTIDQWRGHEDFRFPATQQILGLPPAPPDILHCHNLHGGYFDLRQLPQLSRKLPVVLTLHDEWTFTGHCAYTLGCDRWLTGCGSCPDLSIYPPIRRDATAKNWRVKRAIYQDCRFFVTTPSRWLMEEAEQSILAPALRDTRVIHNGVDLDVFRPQQSKQARLELGLPLDPWILLCAANQIRSNRFKDYATLRQAVAQIAKSGPSKNIVFLVLGDSAPPEQIDGITARFIPFEKDPATMARYYQAADLFLHAAKCDNFPTTVLEALACGTPVIATAVGGIPEQVRSLRHGKGPDQATGVLVEAGDWQAIARTVPEILADDALMAQLSKNAVRDARQRFDLKRQLNEYLEWYQHALSR